MDRRNLEKSSASHALDHVPDGSVVGLGTGRAATAFVHALAERVRGGLRVRAVPTSEATAALAQSLGIELVSIDDVHAIDVTVDGADEVDPALNLIKGYGGALLREKIVATASNKVLILVGPEKLVPVLGTRGRLPIEVVPFGAATVAKRLAALGCPAERRASGGRRVVTDNGNRILDAAVGPIRDPAALDRALREIPGVVATGIFVDLADLVLVEEPAGVRILEGR